jgi:glycosyltransferase involved in cell wall biosynthesis
VSKSELNKVLFATFDVVPDPTGSSARSTALLAGLAASFDVDALTTKTPNHAHIERYHGARLLRVPVGSGDVRSRADAFDRAVRRQIQSEEYDLVHFTDPFGGFALCEMRPTAGYRLVYDVRGFPSVELRYTEPHLEGDRKFLTKLRRQEIFCLMNADVVLAACPMARDHILSLGVPAEKVHVAAPPVDVNRFSVDTEPSGDPCRLLYLGSHASWQGLPSLMFALRLVAQRTKFTARIVGPSHGSWKQQLQDMAREFDLREIVKIEDPVPHEDVVGLLAASDVGLAPLMKVDRNMVQGAAPMKVAEYLVAGRPVVTSDLPACRDLVEHEATGLLYPATDEEALAECIVRLCEDADLRQRLGAEARSRGRSRFDAAAYQRQVLGLYRAMVSPSIIVSDEAFEPDAAPRPAFDDPTVTLPAGMRPEDEPPPSRASPDEITQIGIGAEEPDTDPRVRAKRRHGDGDTGSVEVGELPWGEGLRETPAHGTAAPDPQEMATGEVPVGHLGGEETSEEPPAEEPPVSELTATATTSPPPEPPPAAGPPEAAVTVDRPASPDRFGAEPPEAAVTAEQPVSADRPVTEPPEAAVTAEQPVSADRPLTEPPEAAVTAERPVSADRPVTQPSVPAPPPPPADATERAPTDPNVDASPEAPQIQSAGSPIETDDDDLEEIDPDDAILLEDADEPLAPVSAPSRPTTDPATGRLSSGRDPLLEGEPTDETELPPAVPVVRGRLVEDAAPAPEYGEKSTRRRRGTEEDTSPGV